MTGKPRRGGILGCTVLLPTAEGVGMGSGRHEGTDSLETQNVS